MARQISLWSRSLALLSLCASYAAALGAHGARERCFAWAAYELETGAQASRPITPTVAPDCARSFGHPDKRCSTSEFMQYIWAPDPDVNRLPRTSPIVSVEPPKNRTFNHRNCWNSVKNAYDKPGNGGVKYVNPQRLFPGATSYGDALARIGQSVSTALTSYHINDGMLPTAAQRFADMATDSIKEVQAIRYMDYEEKRLPALRTLRSLGGMRIGTRQIDVSWMQYRSFPALDFQATLELNPALSAEHVESILVSAVEEINNAVTGHDTHGNEIRDGRNHYEMLEHTRIAMTSAKCALPRFPPFKAKRRLNGEVSQKVTVDR